MILLVTALTKETYFSNIKTEVLHGYEAFENAEFTIYGDPCQGFMK